MSSTYTHTVLPDDQSIRLLVLEPGDGASPLEGRLRTVNVRDARDHEPLSYVWGSLILTEKILVDGSALGITSSVHHALKRLRLPNATRTLWVDQVCIDQKNVEERNQQVKFMSKIYKNATRVLVWLGPDGEQAAEAAFDLVRTLAEIFEDEKKRQLFGADHMDDLARRSSQEWDPLRALTKLPWFTRTWIVQEIGTTAPATLLWGDAEIDWHTVHIACEELTHYHHLRKKFHINTAEMKYIYQRFIEPERTSRHANRFSFVYELHRARHLRVTDPRDRVFAFLGHYSRRESPNAHLRSLDADYKKTLEDVYVDLAARTLRDDVDPLITLAAVQSLHLPSARSFAQAEKQRLPTWVPDWRTFQSHIISEPTSPHYAGGMGKSKLEIDVFNGILTVYGIEIDTIDVCSTPLKSGEFHIPESTMSGRSTIERLWHEICGKSYPMSLEDKYINGDPAVLAYTQTLSNACVAIWWREQGELQDQHRQSYHQVPKSQWLAHGAAYLSQTLDGNGIVSDDLRNIGAQVDKQPHQWSRAANGVSTNRILARTTKGYYVLGPKVMESGDVIGVLLGGKVPYCLRPWGDVYLLVGECYVHGLMSGEAVEMMEAGKVVERKFNIA